MGSKRVWLVETALMLALLLLAGACGGQGSAPAPPEAPAKREGRDVADLTIKTGTYFGECIGICRDTLTITSETMDYAAFSNLAHESSPEVADGRATGADEWNKLVSLVNVDALGALPDRIGDPDAADEGGEFVEISAGGATKRVDFSFQSSVPEIDDLLEVLREIRGEFAARNR